MRFLILVLMFMMNTAMAGVIEDPFAGKPIELRIVRIGTSMGRMQLYDSNGHLRLDFQQDREALQGEANIGYYSSNGQRLGSRPIGEDLHLRLIGLRRTVDWSCPVYLTLSRETLEILKIEVRKCELSETVSYKIDSARAPGLINAVAYENVLPVMSFSFHENEYRVLPLSDQILPMSEELSRFFFRAMKTVNEECPVYVTIRRANLEIVKVQPTCDVMN